MFLFLNSLIKLNFTFTLFSHFSRFLLPLFPTSKTLYLSTNFFSSSRMEAHAISAVLLSRVTPEYYPGSSGTSPPTLNEPPVIQNHFRPHQLHPWIMTVTHRWRLQSSSSDIQLQSDSLRDWPLIYTFCRLHFYNTDEPIWSWKRLRDPG